MAVEAHIDIRFTFEVAADEDDPEYLLVELVRVERTGNTLPGEEARGLGERWMQSDKYHVEISQDLIGVVADGDVVKYGRGRRP